MTATASPEAPSSAAATASADVMAEPTILGRFPVGANGPELALRCYGRGAPAVVFEAGDDSSGDVFPTELVRPLAETHLTCLYDRLGTGTSDPPDKPRRTLDDVAADFEALFTAAGVSPPFVLVGSSGGGNIAIWYAVRHPRDVAGLALLDVPGPNPDLGKEFPGALAWAGSEHIDWADAERRESELTKRVGTFPVLIVTADQGQSDPTKPSPWRKLFPRSREIVMHGGHDLYREIPEEVAAKIHALLDEI